MLTQARASSGIHVAPHRRPGWTLICAVLISLGYVPTTYAQAVTQSRPLERPGSNLSGRVEPSPGAPAVNAPHREPDRSSTDVYEKGSAAQTRGQTATGNPSRQRLVRWIANARFGIPGFVALLFLFFWLKRTRHKMVEKPRPTADGSNLATTHHSSPRATGLVDEAKRLYAANKLEDSERLLRELLLDGEETAEGSFYLGLIYTYWKRIPEAEKCFTRATQLDPDKYDAHFYLADILLSRNDNVSAVQHYLKTVELRPDHAAAREKLATLNVAVPQRAFNTSTSVTPAEDARAVSDNDESVIMTQLRKRAETDPQYRTAVNLIDDLRSGVRKPLMKAYLQDFVVFALASFALLTIAYYVVSGEEGLVSVILPLILTSIVCAAVPFFVYYEARKSVTRMSIDCGIISIEGGVFNNNKIRHNIYRISNFMSHQNFFNMLTGDGSLWLIEGEPVEGKPLNIVADLKGFGTHKELSQIAEKCADLRQSLRSLPDLDKGIMQ